MEKLEYAIKLMLFALLAAIGNVACAEPKANVPSAEPTIKNLENPNDSVSIRTRQKVLDEHYRKRKIFRASQLREKEARSLMAIAELIRSDSADRSLEHLYDALAISEIISNPRLKAEIYLAISEIHKSRQNYQMALIALERHYKMVDSLKNVQVAAEEKMLRIADRNVLERTVAISTVISALLIAIVSGFFYIRTKG